MLAEMSELSMAYDGDMVLPLPELDRTERSAVANLIAQDIDQKAMRVASTLPDVWFPPTRPGQDLAERNSRVSRSAVLGWWDHSTMDLKLGRRARWLLGYGCAPAQVRWDPVAEVPVWQLWNPLCTFPAMGDDPDDLVPSDCIFAYRRSEAWLNARYGFAMQRLSKGSGHGPDTMFELLECCDATERTLLVVGIARDRNDQRALNGVSLVEVLETVPNPTGMPTVAVPGRITLGRRQGAYKGMVNQQYAKAKLFALEQIAVTAGVFPDTYLVGRPNENPQIIEVADGKRGHLGRVKGGQLEPLAHNPGYKTGEMIDRIEREERTGAGSPAEFSGESASNIRTGRRGDAILSAAIDFPVQEACRIFERSLAAENRMALALARCLAPNAPKTFYVTWGKAKGRVDYIPAKHFVSDANMVSFPHAGSDANALLVGLGQRLGIDIMSRRKAMQIDPLQDDPDTDADQIVAEKLEMAMLSSVVQGAQAGTMDPATVARIAMQFRQGDTTIEEAILKIQAQKQVEQATAGPPGTPAGPVAPGAPAAQPGLGGAQAPPQAGAIAPTPNEQGLAQLLGALRGGAPNPAGVR